MNADSNKTLFRHAVEGVVITAAGDAFYKVLTLIGTFVILAWLSPYDYGIWRLLQAAVTATSIVALSGVTGVFVADIARALGDGEKARASRIAWKAASLLTVGGLAAGIALALAAPFVTAASGLMVTEYLLVLSLGVAAGGVLQALQVSFQARLMPIRAQVAKNIGALAYLLALAYLVGASGMSVMGVVVAYAASVLVPVVLFLPTLLAMRREGNDEGADYSVRAMLGAKGFWALATDYATILSAALWPWIIGYFMGVEQVGYIGIAMVLVAQVTSAIPIQYVLRGILPRFGEDADRLREWMERSAKYSVAAHLAAALAVTVAAYLVLGHLFPQYQEAFPLFLWLLLAIPFRALAGVAAEWFYATGRQRELFVSSALPKLIALVFLPPLVGFFGFAGFVAWLVLSSDAILLMRLSYMKRHAGIVIRYSKLFTVDAVDSELFSRAVLRVRSAFTRTPIA